MSQQPTFKLNPKIEDIIPAYANLCRIKSLFTFASKIFCFENLSPFKNRLCKTTLMQPTLFKINYLADLVVDTMMKWLNKISLITCWLTCLCSNLRFWPYTAEVIEQVAIKIDCLRTIITIVIIPLQSSFNDLQQSSI